MPSTSNVNAASVEAVNPRTGAASASSRAAASSSSSARPLDRNELTLLQLCFDESEFGLLPSGDCAAAASSAGEGQIDRRDSSPAAMRRNGNDTERRPSHEGAAAPAPPPAFDAALFVTEKLQHVPLAVLEADLQTYHKYLQGEVLRKIHDSVHEAFIQVSGRLVGTQEELLAVREPLSALQARVEAAVGVLNGLKQSADAHIAKAQEHEFEAITNSNLLRGLLLHEKLCQVMEGVSVEMRALGIDVRERQQASASPSTTPNKSVSSSSQQQQLLHSVSLGAEAGGEASLASAAAAAPQESLEVLLAALHDATIHVVQAGEVVSAIDAAVASGVIAGPTFVAERDEAQKTAASDKEAVLGALAATFLHIHSLCNNASDANSSAPHRASSSTEAAAALARILRCYRSLREEAAVAALCRDQVVRPLVEEAISWKRAAEARQSIEEARRLIARVCEQLERSVYALLLPLLRDVLAPAIFPLTAIVWPVVSEVVQKRMSFLFVPGIPATFHANYLAAHQLVMAVEAQCTSLEELHDLRASPEVGVVWRRKWNLDVYMTLRSAELQERAKAVLATTALQLGSAAAAAAAPPVAVSSAKGATSPSLIAARFPLEVKQLAELREMMMWVLSDDVFLFALAPQLVRAALVTQHEVMQHLLRLAHAAARGDDSDGGAVEDSDESAAVNKVLRLCADLSIFAKFVEEVFIPRINEVTHEPPAAADAGRSSSSSSSSPGGGSALTAAAKIAAGAPAAAREEALEALRAAVVDKCRVALQSIRTIKAIYVVKTRPLPSGPSVFVSSIIAPITSFKKALECQRTALDAAASTALIRAVVEDVTVQFRVVAKELLTADRRMKENWDRYRSARGGGAGAGAGGPTQPSSPSATSPCTAQPQGRPTSETATALDKIVVQLYLDAHEFGSLLRPFGINKESYAPLQALLKLVRRANWILGDDIREPPLDIEDDD